MNKNSFFECALEPKLHDSTQNQATHLHTWYAPSGTTMITRALAEAGVHVGTVCDHNSEALYTIDINERIFLAAGGSWWSPPTKEAILQLQWILKPT